MTLRNAISLPLGMVALMWFIHLTRSISGLTEAQYTVMGIMPREGDGMMGILTSPLIHGSWNHLISNSIPFLVLGTMIRYFYPKISLLTFWGIWFIGGALVWLLAWDGGVWHIGCSGVIYGFAAFLAGSGFFRKNLRAIAIALVVGLLYGGLVLSLLHKEQGISWDSHFWGFVVGLALSYSFRNTKEREEVAAPRVVEQKEHFLPRDIFEMTKQQRIEQEEERSRFFEF